MKAKTGRKPNPETPQIVRDQLLEYYNMVGSWGKVGKVLGVSSSYAMQVAKGRLNARPDIVEKWLEFAANDDFDYRLVDRIVSIPIFADSKMTTIAVNRMLPDGDFEDEEITQYFPR